MLTSAPVFVHPAQLPTHLPPPPIFLTPSGTLLFPPGFIPPPFPAVSDEEELQELCSFENCSSPDLSDSIYFSSSSSEASVASPLETISLENVTLNIFSLTGDEEEEMKVYAKVQEEVKTRRLRKNSTTSSGYGYSVPMTPNTEILFDTVC